MQEVILRFQGLKFIVPKETECFWPYYGICFVGEYDPILSHIDSSDVVIDAGANIGIFTLLASRKARKVIAVEPDPENFRYLKENVRLNKTRNVILINKALSNYVGYGFIFGRGLSATLSHKGIPIKVTTIDEMIKELSLDSFDVLKMDIEGAELDALSGKFLGNIRELMVEVHGKMSYQIIRSRLEDEGFVVSEWSFSPSKVLRKILVNFWPLISAELKTRFIVTTLALKYMFGLSVHLVPAAEEASGIKLVYASRRKV